MPSAQNEQRVCISSMYAAMSVIRDFTDPATMILGRPQQRRSAKERWLYERLLAVHKLAREAVERDERESG